MLGLTRFTLKLLKLSYTQITMQSSSQEQNVVCTSILKIITLYGVLAKSVFLHFCICVHIMCVYIYFKKLVIFDWTTIAIISNMLISIFCHLQKYNIHSVGMLNLKILNNYFFNYTETILAVKHKIKPYMQLVHNWTLLDSPCLLALINMLLQLKTATHPI